MKAKNQLKLSKRYFSLIHIAPVHKYILSVIDRVNLYFEQNFESLRIYSLTVLPLITGLYPMVDPPPRHYELVYHRK